jgi:hypothetical protein
MTMKNEDLRNHQCGTDRWPEYDGRGIFLCYVCHVCREAKLKRFRDVILHTAYTQDDVCEPIEPEEE